MLKACAYPSPCSLGSASFTRPFRPNPLANWHRKQSQYSQGTTNRREAEAAQALLAPVCNGTGELYSAVRLLHEVCYRLHPGHIVDPVGTGGLRDAEPQVRRQTGVPLQAVPRLWQRRLQPPQPTSGGAATSAQRSAIHLLRQHRQCLYLTRIERQPGRIPTAICVRVRIRQNSLVQRQCRHIH